jgi:hypothetical protein
MFLQDIELIIIVRYLHTTLHQVRDEENNFFFSGY